MKTNILPVLLWILHAEDSDLRHIPEITRLDIFDGASSDFHDDGLFSTRIFGLVGSDERDANYGKIKLKTKILHPKIYRDLCALRELYRQIMDGAAMAKFNEKEGDFYPSVEEDAETGYAFFMKHLDKLVFKKNNSLARNERIRFIEKWRHRMTMSNLVVMPAGLRDVEVGSDGRTTKNEINDLYYRVLSIATSISVSDDMNDPAYDMARRSLQMSVYDIYQMIENIIGGKDGFIKAKWASRRVREGTRNVLTSMNTSGLSLDSPNVPGFESTVLGIYQAAVCLAPLVIHWMRVGPLAKILESVEGSVPLIDKKTLRTDWVNLPPYERDKWTTEDGLRDVIQSLVDVEARRKPIEIMDHYLALVYFGEDTFKIFHDIDELPEHLSRKNVHPLTLVELIYLCGYSKWAKHFTDVVRYPITGDDSTYPSRMYVKTTSVGEVRRELDESWMPMEGDDYLAVEYPKLELSTYHESESPHPGRLRGLGADFDGDTGSSTAVMIKDSIEENERYLMTRAAWVAPNGEMRADIEYDTSELVIRNLTGRFDHVRNVQRKHLQTALRTVSQ